MMDAQHILAVDLGTSGCKTALVSLEGRVAGWAFTAVPLHILPGGGVEQDPSDWWNAFVSSARKVLTETKFPPAAVAAICCSCAGEGTVAVDREGRALRNAILYADARGGRHIRRHVRGLLNVVGYDALKLVRWVRLTGGAPSLTGKDPAAHMLLIRNEHPDVYAATYKFLNVLDYMNLRLTGRFVATSDSILTSWVTDNRHLERIRYDQGLLAASGIANDKFPELVACTEVLGGLLPHAASELGLPCSTPVVAGAVDTSAAAIGSGAVADYDPHLYVGTSSWIGAHVAFKKTDVLTQVASVPCAAPARYLMIAMQSVAGGALAFLKDRILFNQPRSSMAEVRPTCHNALSHEVQPPNVYELLDQMAVRAPAGSHGLFFAPWFTGERSPAADSHLRAGLFNLSLEHSRQDVVRACLEGVALNTRWMLKPVERFLGRRLEELTIVGGGGVSDLWCQIFADVLGVRIRQLQEPMQSNALGAAYIGAVGLGLMTFDKVPSLTRVKAIFAPQAAHRDLYDRAFDVFLEFHRRLRPLYGRING
jgi:xylulokinase